LKKLFVGNLDFKATEDSVRTLFAAYGAVESVHLATDRDTGRARGFAFVEMAEGTWRKATPTEPSLP
jgi:RNA recognition motif-containing protein